MKKINLKYRESLKAYILNLKIKPIIVCLISAIFIVTSLPLKTVSESLITDTPIKVGTEYAKKNLSISEYASTVEIDSLNFLKDETVYAMLDSDGSFDGDVSIVNFIHTLDSLSDGKLHDSGIYDRLFPLSADAKYTVSDGRNILWDFNGADSLPEGFFYRGEKSGTMLPFNFEIEYSLDGKNIAPTALAGKSGDFRMEISVTSNSSVYSYYLENFAAQIQIPLNIQKFSEIAAPGASKVLTGQTRILNLTVLPGKSQSFTIESKVKNFEMDVIQIAVTPFSTDVIKQIIPEDIKDKLGELSNGVAQISEGGSKLNNGIIELSEGIEEINDGFSELSAGQENLFTGIEEYLSGVKEIADGHTGLSSGLEEVSFGGIGLTQAYEDLRNEISAFLDSLIPIIETLPDEEKLPVIERIGMIKEQLNIYDHHLNQYIEVISNISTSSKELSDGLVEISDKNENIQAGISGLVMGSENFASGLNSFENESSGLTEGSSALAGSLSLLSKELADASVIFQDLIPQNGSSEPISFADKQTGVNSVTFIISVPAIKMSAPAESEPEEISEKSFWDRFLDLFRKNK